MSSQQRVIRVHIPIEYPFVYRINPSNKDSALTGFFYDVWVQIAKDLRSHGYEIRESIGSPKDTEHWVNAIHRGKYDIVVTPATQSFKRESKVHVSSILFITYFSLIERNTSNSWYQLFIQLIFYELIPLFVGLSLLGLIVGYVMYLVSKTYTKKALFSYSLYNVINMFGTSSNLSSYLTDNNITKQGRPRKGILNPWWWWGIFIFITAIAVVISSLTRSYITTRMVQEKGDDSNRIDAQNISSKVILARSGSTSGAIVANIANKVYYKKLTIAELIQHFNTPSGSKYDALVMQTFDAHQAIKQHPTLVESPIDLGASSVGMLQTRRPDMAKAIQLMNYSIERMVSDRTLYNVCKQYLTNPDDAACIA